MGEFKSGRGGNRPGSGRPKGSTKDTGKKMRSMRLTDELYEDFKRQIKNQKEKKMNKTFEQEFDELLKKYYPENIDVPTLKEINESLVDCYSLLAEADDLTQDNSEANKKVLDAHYKISCLMDIIDKVSEESEK